MSTGVYLADMQVVDFALFLVDYLLTEDARPTWGIEIRLCVALVND